jgi:hypothetical protein
MFPEAVRRSHGRRAALLGALGIALLAPSSAFAVASPVSACGAVISSPGDYVLTQDLTCNNQIDIRIDASDVNFSLNGHTITGGQQFGVLIGLSSPLNNVHVTGPGQVKNTTGAAFDINQATNSSVAGVSATGNVYGAVAGNSMTQLGNVISDNNFAGNSNGVQVNNGQVEVARNICSGATSFGILLAGGSGRGSNNVHHNTCKNGTGSGKGIVIGSGSGNNQVHHNTATGNPGQDAIDLNANCGTNQWFANLFVTFSPPCAGNAPGNGAGPECTITGTAGADRLTGTSGNDVICGLGGDDVLDGRGGNDEIYGDEGDDEVIGKGGNDKLFGGDGVDLLLPGSGNDTADGGASVRDRVLYSDITGGGVNVFLSSGAVSPEAGSNVGSDQLSNIEQVFGSEFDDILVAQIAGVASTVKGGGGDDHLDTDDGDGLDAMVGNAGSDICAGNPGDRIAEC